jgi:hypothetical protein
MTLALIYSDIARVDAKNFVYMCAEYIYVFQNETA